MLTCLMEMDIYVLDVYIDGSNNNNYSNSNDTLKIKCVYGCEQLYSLR